MQSPTTLASPRRGDARLIGRAPAEGRLWDIDTRHELMITEPETADALLQVAAA